MSETHVQNDRCRHKFIWDDSAVLTSAEIKTVNGHVTEVDFGTFAIRNQSCYRETAPGQESCEWHSQSYSKIESHLLDVEKKYVNGVIPEVRFDNIVEIDFSDLVLPYSQFKGNVEHTSFDNTILVYSNFSNAIINGVSFDESHLEEALFVGAQIDQDHDWGNRTRFQQCILKGADFSGAKFNRPEFCGSSFDAKTKFSHEQDISGADFSGCDLSNVDLSNTIIRKCNFNGCNLNNSVFSQEIVSNSSFINANCLGTDFTKSHLEGAKMSEANLKSADFKKAEIDSVDFTNAQINYQSEFGSKTIYETRSVSAVSYDRHAGRILKAIWTYRALQKIHRDNSLLEKYSHYYKKEKDIRRRQHRREITNDVDKNILNEYQTTNSVLSSSIIKYRSKIVLKYIKYELSRFSIRYGESLLQLILFSTAVVVVFAAIYPLFGVEISDRILQYSFMSDNSNLSSLSTQLFYGLDFVRFSFFVFTQTGMGGAQAIGLGQFFVAVQSVIGAAVIALGVFVLTRRATR